VIKFQRITFDYSELSRKALAQFGQCGQATAVHFDRGDARSGPQQGAGQPARAGADFEHLRAGQVAGQGSNARQKLFIEQEILPQCLGRGEVMTLNNLANRGKINQCPFALSLSKGRPSTFNSALEENAGLRQAQPERVIV
jgi:hypothetical protein